MEPLQKVDEQYKGPGRLTSALGLASLYSIIPSIATGVVTYFGIAKLESSDVTGAAAEKLARGLKIKSGIGTFITVAAGVAGLVVGWKKASHAEKQYETVARSHNAALDKVAALSENNAQLLTEVSTEKRRFTEAHGKHRGINGEHASHADKVIAEKHAAKDEQLAV